LHVTTIDRYSPGPGVLLQWSVNSSAGRAVTSPVPPSFNQAFHLAGADAGTVWLAAAFDVDGRIDTKALERAYRVLIARHGTLHSGFVKGDGGIERELHDASKLALEQRTAVETTTSAELRDVLWSSLNDACHPFGFPAYLLAAIDRADRSTVFCGFDHSHVDAYSMSIIVDDLHQLYQAAKAEPGGFIGDDMPMAGNFVDYCAAESDAVPVGPTDPRMRAWLDFFAEHDNRAPSFPLDLGLPVGEKAPQAVDLRHLLGPEATDAFEARCRRAGASVFAGVLAAMAQCVRVLGGGSQLALLFPVHTRRSEPWQNAVGWFTTNAPLTVSAAEDFTETLTRTGPALRDAVKLGEVPVPQVLEALGGIHRDRDDIFMVSFVDYRTLPGSGTHDEIGATHVSNVTEADDVQFWISRTDRGLALRTRFPDTVASLSVIDAFLGELERILSADR
jgi:hypothetical protein